MKIAVFAFMALSVLFNSGAHIILKYNARLDGPWTRNLNPLVNPQVSVLFILGALCFATSIFFYQAVLRTAQLSVAFAVLTGFNYIIIMIFSLAFLREGLRPMQYVGLALTFIGLCLLLAWYEPEKKPAPPAVPSAGPEAAP
ncbi:MAG: SMR family transporter [Planctomycetota bacterium]